MWINLILLVGGSKNENVTAKISGFEITESKKEKLLGIEIDNELTLNEHVLKLCKKSW